jgi:hypothetical protein
MDADDLVERGLGTETQRQRAGRIEPARPASDDAGDQRIWRAADAGGDLVSGHAA